MAQQTQYHRASPAAEGSAHHQRQQLHVDQEETVEALVFTVNLSGFRVEDAKVQLEDEQTLILSNTNTTRRIHLPPEARPEAIRASRKDGVLTITIPKSVPK